jgi:hypothetical protein
MASDKKVELHLADPTSLSSMLEFCRSLTGQQPTAEEITDCCRTQTDPGFLRNMTAA